MSSRAFKEENKEQGQASTECPARGGVALISGEMFRGRQGGMWAGPVLSKELHA